MTKSKSLGESVFPMDDSKYVHDVLVVVIIL